MIIIDKSYRLLNETLRGKKPKVKLEKDGVKYIFKYGAVNYEIWAELIAEQLGKQLGIEMAHYDIACYGNIIGVLTPLFFSDDELIFSSDYLKKSAYYMFKENNISESLKENTIFNIIKATYAFNNDIDSLEKLGDELTKRWLFFMLIMESDKNETNIGFIKGHNGIRLTPDYDNASIARLNENINDFIDVIRLGYSDIRIFTKEIKNSLYLTEDNNGIFLHDFTIFCQNHPEHIKEYLELFSKIDIETAIKEVEKNNNVEVPWEVKYWLSKAIMTRLEDMQFIYKEIDIKTKKKYSIIRKV